MAETPFKADEKTPCKVLLIDEDPKSVRLVRSALSGTGFNMLPCTRHTEGVRLASRHRVELIILADHFRDADAMALAVKLIKHKNAKVVFISHNGSLVSRLRGLMLGAVDYLHRGLALPQIRSRLRDALALDAPPTPCLVPGTPEAKKAEILFGQIRRLEELNANGVLELASPGGMGRLALVAGEVRGARAGTRRGDAALNALARRADWDMTFHEGVKLTDLPPLPGTAEDSTPPPFGVGEGELVGLEDISPVDPEDLTTAPDLGDSGFSDPCAFHRGVDATSPTMQDYAAVSVPGQRASPSHQEEPTLEEDVRGLLVDGDDEASEANDATGEFQVAAPGEDIPFPDEELEPQSPTLPNGEARFRGHHSESSIRSRVPAPRELLRTWLGRHDTAPLLLVFPQEEVRRALELRAEALGFTVASTTTGGDAMELIRSLRPVAIMADLNLPDLDGRELLAQVRADFCLREIPFLVISGEDLAHQLFEMEAEAVDPVILGLESALGPRVKLFGRLQPRDSLTLPGAVEPVGIATLLRTLGGCRSSGHLLLKTGLTRNAEVIFRRGTITAVTVHRPISDTGNRAVTQLVGLEWRQFIFMPENPGKADRQGLGDLDELLEQASQSNNEFLDRLYQRGLRQQGVAVDDQAMEAFLQTLPTGSMAVLMSLKEGGSLKELNERGEASFGVVRALLVELRRRGAVRPISAVGHHPGEITPRPVHTTARMSFPSAGEEPPAERASSHGGAWLVPLLVVALAVSVFAITFLLLTR